jgi:hypothetical protein
MTFVRHRSLNHTIYYSNEHRTHTVSIYTSENYARSARSIGRLGGSINWLTITNTLYYLSVLGQEYGQQLPVTCVTSHVHKFVIVPFKRIKRKCIFWLKWIGCWPEAVISLPHPLPQWLFNNDNSSSNIVTAQTLGSGQQTDRQKHAVESRQHVPPLCHSLHNTTDALSTTHSHVHTQQCIANFWCQTRWFQPATISIGLLQDQQR